MDKDDRQQNMPEIQELDIPAPRAAEEPQASSADPGKKHPKRLGTLVMILAAVLAVTVLTTMEDGRHFASLRRWLMYGDPGTSLNMYLYPPDKGNQWGLLGEDLLVASPNGVQLCKDDGSTIYQIPLSAKEPSLSVGRDMAAVCDVGGKSVYILDRVGLRTTLKTEGDMRFYTARLNSKDILTVTEEKSGYKTSVTVYDKDLEPMFHFDSHDSYLSDATVTDDGKYLVAVRMDTEGGMFTSRILVYDIATAEKVSDAPIKDGMVLELHTAGDKVLSLCDKRLMVTDLRGGTHLDRSYGSLYLHGCALGGKDFSALLLGRYQSGNICTLTTYSMEGEEIASLELTEEVLDMSAAGGDLAVLYSNSLVIYDKTLQEKARLESTDFAGHVQMAENGTAVVIRGSSAQRFLP